MRALFCAGRQLALVLIALGLWCGVWVIRRFFCWLRASSTLRYQAQGKLEKAVEFGQKGLDIKVNALGENHPEVAKSYSILGNT